MDAYPHYDYDDPYTAPTTSTNPYPNYQQPPRPWSAHGGGSVDPNFGDDGGAIARYLDRQERGYAVATAENGPRHDGGWDTAPHHYRRRREASELSVEALDLADYTHTIHRQPGPSTTPFYQRPIFPPLSSPQINEPLPETYSRYPTPRRSPIDADVPIVDRPFSAQSRSSAGRSIGPPPSLAASLTTSNNSHRQLITPSPRRNQRHLSLPPVAPGGWPVSREPAIFSSSSNQSHQGGGYLGSPRSNSPDIRTFPKWSRAWYDSEASKKRKSAPADPFATNGPSMIPSVDSRKTINEQFNSLPQEADLGVWPPQASANYSPHRQSYPMQPQNDSPLPWGQQDPPPDYISPEAQQERMRMLEKEFGEDGKARIWQDPQEMIGGVDEAGELITDGPRRRSAVRWTQTLFAVIVAATGIYGALAIHPSIPAPPAGKAPAYVMYAFSVATVLFSLWFYHTRPCLRRRRKRKNDKFTRDMNPAGMMILPIVQGLGGGKKGKKSSPSPMPMMGGRPGKKPKKGKNHPGEGVQVNLIVDPTMLLGGTGRARRNSHSDPEDDGRWSDEERGSRRSGPKGRRSVIDGLRMEQDWKAARKALKWQLFVDVMLMVLWAAVFFFFLWGERCPIGGFNGW